MRETRVWLYSLLSGSKISSGPLDAFLHVGERICFTLPRLAISRDGYSISTLVESVADPAAGWGGGEGQETWNLCDRLWWPSFLWLIFTGPKGTWSPWSNRIRYWESRAGFEPRILRLLQLHCWSRIMVCSHCPTQRPIQRQIKMGCVDRYRWSCCVETHTNANSHWVLC